MPVLPNDPKWQVYRLEPCGSPFFTVNRASRRKLSKSLGGKMQKRRRRMMKPIRFTPRDSLRKVHDWTRDELVSPAGFTQILAPVSLIDMR